MTPEQERFKAKTSTDPNTGCWNWTGSRLPDGYGKVSFKNKVWRAHRLAYFLFKGDIGEYHVCHQCDNPSCVNPDHFVLGNSQGQRPRPNP